MVGETDEIEREEDGTLAREIAGVDPGSVEGVEAETIATNVDSKLIQPSDSLTQESTAMIQKM